MSSIKLTADSGGGTVELKAPATTGSNANKQFILPQNDGSASQALLTDGAGNLSFAAAGGGKILQVVEGSTTTEATSNSTSFSDSNLSGSITPSSTSSKILVLVNQAYCVFRDTGSSVNGRLILLRDSTVILDQTTSQDNTLGFTVNNYGAFLRLGMRVPLFKLDSPNTTSSVTYKTQIATIVTSNDGKVQAQRDNMISTIELLEVSA